MIAKKQGCRSYIETNTKMLKRSNMFYEKCINLFFADGHDHAKYPPVYYPCGEQGGEGGKGENKIHMKSLTF